MKLVIEYIFNLCLNKQRSIFEIPAMSWAIENIMKNKTTKNFLPVFSLSFNDYSIELFNEEENNLKV